MTSYPLLDQEHVDLDKRFTYHKPTGDQPIRYSVLGQRARDLAEDMMFNAPRSRELSLALTKLEEAVMWVNAAIARNE